MTNAWAPPLPPPCVSRPTKAPTRRSVPIWQRLLAGAAVAVGIALDRSSVGLVVLVFVIVVPFERWFPRHRQPLRRPHLGTDVAYALASAALTLLGIAVGVVLAGLSLLWLPGLALRPVVQALPGWARAVTGVALFDLLVYWAHRFGHEVPFLWRFHRIHHSTDHLDWVSGFRAHPLDGIFLAPAYVLLLAAGFSDAATGAVLAVQVVTGLFLHANVRWRWRPLHRIVNTPEFHHWHHSNEPEARNANYAAFLPLWDQLFGTYRMPADARPQRYGVDGAVSPGLVGQLWDPVRGLPNPLGLARHPRAAAGRLVRALGRGRRQLVASARRR